MRRASWHERVIHRVFIQRVKEEVHLYQDSNSDDIFISFLSFWNIELQKTTVLNEKRKKEERRKIAKKIFHGRYESCSESCFNNVGEFCTRVYSHKA